MHKKIGPFQLWWNFHHEDFGDARYFGGLVRLGSLRLNVGATIGELQRREGKWVCVEYDRDPKFVVALNETAPESG